MPIIAVSGLSKSYRVHQKRAGLINSAKDFFARKYCFNEAVKGLDLNINEGEIVGLLGENGAGKTTTLKMLSGILHPSSGEVDVCGYVPLQRKKGFLRKIAFVMGNRQQLFWDLPARETFNYQREVYELPYERYKKNLEMLIELLNVESLLDFQIRTLSLGERMKMELINNFLYDPEVVFLDEPTLGLDLMTQKKIRRFLVDYNRERNSTIIVTSHYMDDIEATCSRVVMLKEGIKIFDSSIQDLLKKYAFEKVLEITFEEKPDVNDLKKFGKIISDEGLKIRVLVPKDKSASIISDIVSQFPNLRDISFSGILFEQLVENFMGGS